MARECPRGEGGIATISDGGGAGRGDGGPATKCFECGEMGHMSYDCPFKQQRKRKLPPELISKQQELGQFARERAKALSDDQGKRKLSAQAMLGTFAAPKGKTKALPGGVVLVKKKGSGGRDGGCAKSEGVVEEKTRSHAGGEVGGCGLDSLAEYGSEGSDSE